MTSTGIAPAIREKVTSSRDRFWRPDDFDGPPEAVAKALSRLADAGDLRRVRRGLYWRGTATRAGTAPPPPALLGGAGPSQRNDRRAWAATPESRFPTAGQSRRQH